MEDINKYKIHPKSVADKSVKNALPIAIELALKTEVDALRENTQSFNNKRYRTTEKIDDYGLMKNEARKIKERSIEALPDLIKTLTKKIENRGGKVYLAKTKEDAVDYVRKVCAAKHANIAIKSKSITSEEIGLNHALQDDGIEVIETDLAEFILQLSKEQPSHIVAPAIHRTRESISDLFKKNFATEAPLNSGKELTDFARLVLREKFISADVGITGANLISAEEGAVLLVESEGNIRLTTHLPAIHIAISGIEKIIQSREDFGIFIELLSSSGTGQRLTSYTNILEPPITLPITNFNGRDDQKREFHLVLVDNGRMKMREDPELKESLYCIRCSACMNSCANFQTVGGHAFGGECYTGGIGGAWTVGTTDILEKAKFVELCTGCSRCIPNCPVKIDIPGLNTIIKNRLLQAANGQSIEKIFFAKFSLTAKLASLAPGLFNFLFKSKLARFMMEKIVGLDRRRRLPPIANHTLEQLYKIHKKSISSNNTKSTRLLLFADVYTNYNNPDLGISTMNLFNSLGFKVKLSKVIAEGRASQSQGIIEQAKLEAKKVSLYLIGYIKEGYKILVAEPSVLSLFRNDYKKLINDDNVFDQLARNCFDPIEYLSNLKLEEKTDIIEKLKQSDYRDHNIFFHPHCQMRTVGASEPNIEFFNELGYKIEVSTAECCGMAGSFGYKKEFYDISKNLGIQLVNQIHHFQNNDENWVILASGTSCREQISEFSAAEVYHPVQFLEKILSKK